MKLQILSDLHLELSKFEPFATDADVIVLAGDIALEDNGIIWARAVFPNKEIIYVPGNHEFYGTKRLETLELMRRAAHECEVHLLDDAEIVIDGIRFIGSTLWTDFNLFGQESQLAAMNECQDRVNDFRLIHEENQKRFSPAFSVELHEISLAWLIAKLDEPFIGKTVVVTHHLPSSKSVMERFKDSLITACFASELDYLFGKVNLWVHGHTHSNSDYEVKGTRVICNPRGYVTYNSRENFDFNPKLVIEI